LTLITFMPISLILLLILVFALGFLNSRYPNWFFKFLIRLLGFTAGFLLVFLMAIAFVFAFVATVNLTFSGLRALFGYFFKDKFSAAYLSLTITLLVIAYLPEKLGLWYMLLIDKLGKKMMPLADKYVIFVKALRFRLVIYLFAFLLVLLSTLELYSNRIIIENFYWLQYKPVILQSVVSVIAFDRFIKLLSEEKTGIVNDLRKIGLFIVTSINEFKFYK